MNKLITFIALLTLLAGCKTETPTPTSSTTTEPSPVASATASPTATPDQEESLGESSPENAAKALEAAEMVDSDPNLPVMVAIPDGYSTNFSGGHEGSAVIIEGDGGTVHTFIPNAEISTLGEQAVIGDGGLFEMNGWSTMEAGRKTQPVVDWASGVYPFFGPDDLEGVVYLGEFEGKEMRVIVSAPVDKIDAFYSATESMLKTMKLRP